MERNQCRHQQNTWTENSGSHISDRSIVYLQIVSVAFLPYFAWDSSGILRVSFTVKSFLCVQEEHEIIDHTVVLRLITVSSWSLIQFTYWWVTVILQTSACNRIIYVINPFIEEESCTESQQFRVFFVSETGWRFKIKFAYFLKNFEIDIFIADQWPPPST